MGWKVIFLSSLPHTGYLSFWTATRESTSDPWSKPVLVPSLGIPAYAQGRIALSFDGRQLYFSSMRSGGVGGFDLWVATREKLGGKKEQPRG